MANQALLLGGKTRRARSVDRAAVGPHVRQRFVSVMASEAYGCGRRIHQGRAGSLSCRASRGIEAEA